MKWVLRLWGGFSLAMVVYYLAMSAYVSSSSTSHFNPGPTSLPEWIGMCVICLGLAHVITQLERLNQNNEEKTAQRKE